MQMRHATLSVMDTKRRNDMDAAAGSRWILGPPGGVGARAARPGGLSLGSRADDRLPGRPPGGGVLRGAARRAGRPTRRAGRGTRRRRLPARHRAPGGRGGGCTRVSRRSSRPRRRRSCAGTRMSSATRPWPTPGRRRVFGKCRSGSSAGRCIRGSRTKRSRSRLQHCPPFSRRSAFSRRRRRSASTGPTPRRSSPRSRKSWRSCRRPWARARPRACGRRPATSSSRWSTWYGPSGWMRR